MLENKDLMGIGNFSKNDAIENHVKNKSRIYHINASEIALSSILENIEELEMHLNTIERVQSHNRSTSKVHGIQHVKNVLLLSNYIGLRDGVSQEDLALIREAAVYHDVAHKKAGDPTHAKNGAEWYLSNVESSLNKLEVAFLIEAHELREASQFVGLVQRKFPEIPDKRKMELVKLAKMLQDADRLDMLRYDIENPNYQRFDKSRLNDSKNEQLISAVIELNTRQAIKNGFLCIKNGQVLKSMRTPSITTTDER